MYFLSVLMFSIFSTTGVSIIEPEHCADYNLDELPGFRAIVENENEIPDSVSYSLNGEALVQVFRLSTDWPTYMQNYQNHGFSESPAPMTNEILWTAPVTGEGHEFPTPVVVNGIVYYPSDCGTDSLYALDAATGEVIWKYLVGATDDAVTVFDGSVYTASGDSIFCLDVLTGQLNWVSELGDCGGSTPIVQNGFVYCGRNPYVPSDISMVSCLNANTGDPVWIDTIPARQVSCMGIDGDTLYLPTWTQYEYSPLYAIDVSTGEILWENNDAYEGYWDSSPVIVDGLIYINGEDGICRAIDAENGETVWERSLTPDVYISATPAYHNEMLYFADQGYPGTYHCLEALNGTTIWSVPGGQHGSSALADGMIFYGQCNSEPQCGSVVALDCSDGSEVWRYDALSTDWIAGSPCVTDGVVYMAMHDWNLYAFGTGLKYTYLNESLNSQVGWNELVATSYDDGSIAASDTISYYINATGIEFEPSIQLELSGSPNPFIASTSISFSLSDAGFTSIEVYDLSGRVVSELVKETYSAGNHVVDWNGYSQSGEVVSAGLYICRIESGGIVETTGLCLLK